MQPQAKPCRVLLGLHGDNTERFFLKNLYCLECVVDGGPKLVQCLVLVGTTSTYNNYYYSTICTQQMGYVQYYVDMLNQASTMFQISG